jgi:hypothetical protein
MITDGVNTLKFADDQIVVVKDHNAMDCMIKTED